MSPGRRRWLTVAAVIAVAAAVANLDDLVRALLPPSVATEPMPGLEGYRRLADGPGGVSAAGGPLVGIGLPGETPPPRTPEAELRADLCGALFGGPPPEGVVPIASFSDYYCPYCRVLARRLSALETGGGVDVTWHEWPLFGETSEAAAKAALAARRQGAYLAFHDAIIGGGFVPTPAFLAELSGRLRLDSERLARDMESAAVARDIADARGLAGLFGFVGTPALVVGRTALTGAVDEATLAALVEAERAAGPPPGCD